LFTIHAILTPGLLHGALPAPATTRLELKTRPRAERKRQSVTALDALAGESRWVAWRNELRGRKLAKVPYSPDGKKAKADDPSTWGIRTEAQARAEKIVNGLAGGIGIQLGNLGGDMHLSGLDLDSCIADDGALAPWAAEIVSAVPTYTERSPSGRGLKLFFYTATEYVRPLLDRIGVPPDAWGTRRGVPGQDGRDHGPAIEIYFAGRYFAVTEDRWPGTPDRLATLGGPTLDRLAALIPPARSAAGKGRKGVDDSRSALAFRMGMKMRAAGASIDQFSEALRTDPETTEWFSEKGIVGGGRELHRIWQKADPHHGCARRPLVIDPKAPYDIARLFLNAHFLVDGRHTLHRYRGTFYAWNTTAYSEADEEGLRAKLYGFLDQCAAFDRKGEKQPVKPNMRLVGNVFDALAAAAQLDSMIAAPVWLDHRSGLPAEEIICCANGLLHLPTFTLLPHSPTFFTHNAVQFAFEPGAPEPQQWLRFLGELWPDDQAAIETLQEVFGYCLTSDTSQQKMFLIVGPKRSGKGTIARVLTSVIGLDSSVAPTLTGLGTNFGLAPLIGKRAAIISDARLGGRPDQHAIAERLLSITGEDAITIDRKYREAWTGRLQTRFLILSNELPRLADTSGALAGRFIVLVLTRSFYGREDHGLMRRLLTERSSILNWAIAGWRRMTERGYFITPASSADAIRELEDLGSPMGAFLRERCVVAPGRTVETNQLYKAWSQWCAEQGRDHAGTAQTFGRDLRAAVPSFKVTQPRGDDGRFRLYEGIGLR
jgi:putative DNA primase/helicase